MEVNRKKILIISYSNLEYDGRVTRQINFLKGDYQVDVLALENNGNAGFYFYGLEQVYLNLFRKLLLAFLLLIRRFKAAYWVQYPYKSVIKRFKNRDYDLVVANDVESLPLAFEINSKKVFFDAHEYAPRHYEERLWWRVFFQRFNVYLCKTYLPLVKGMITVCDGLAKEYNKEFGVQPEVITNAPNFREVELTEHNHNQIRIIHHGIANASRKMENMLKIMDELGDGYSLDLMLMMPEYASGASKKYFNDFISEVEKRKNVSMIAPVKSAEIVEVIKKYDIGLFLLEPINFNYTNALPNKLFEFIQARLVVAIGPSPEMMKIVKNYDCGIVSDSFNPRDLAKNINELSREKIAYYKGKSAIAAKELNAEVNKERLLQLVQSVI